MNAESKVFLVFLGERANIQTRPREMNPLVRAEDAADHDAALDLVFAYLQSFELDLAVAEDLAVALRPADGRLARAHLEQQRRRRQLVLAARRNGPRIAATIAARARPRA